jgi:hypothetical protein
MSQAGCGNVDPMATEDVTPNKRYDLTPANAAVVRAEARRLREREAQQAGAALALLRHTRRREAVATRGRAPVEPMS